MEKPTITTSYLLKDNRVVVMPYFLYEVSIYKITKNTATIIASKFFKSDKLLSIKKPTTVKKYRNYLVVRYIDILGVTKEFIEDNSLPLYQLKTKKRK